VTRSTKRPLPALHRLAPGVFYGWPVAFGLAGLSSVVVGVGFYGMTVFLDTLVSERGWPRATVSLATTLYFIGTGASGALVGRFVDRQDARVWIAAGTGVMAIALLWLGRIDAPAELLPVYLLLAAGFSMTGNVTTSAVLTRWFVARRARAMSIAQTGVSLGGFVLVPLVAHSARSLGFASTTAWLALLLVAIGWPIAAFVLRGDPRAHGLVPDGADPGAPALDAERMAVQERVWGSREALRTRAFWLLVAAFSAILTCQVGTAMHQLALLRDHLDAGTASLAVSTTAAGSLAARLAVGGFADRVSKRRLCGILMAVQGAALVGFATQRGAPALFAISLLFGVTIGNVFMLQALLVGELFGMRSFAKVLGLLQLVTQTASGLGPWILGLLHDALGGYSGGLFAFSGLALLAAALVWQVRPPPAAVGSGDASIA
jgi:MFS family permease